jgi:hypothetical protein
MENDKFMITKILSGNLQRILCLRKENVIKTYVTESAVLWIGFDGFKSLVSVWQAFSNAASSKVYMLKRSETKG